MGRKTRQEMSGVFDYFKKKKKEEKKSFLEMILPPLPASGLPAERPGEKSVTSYFKPKSQLPAPTEPKKRLLPSFEIFKPKEKKETKEKPFSLVTKGLIPQAQEPQEAAQPLKESLKKIIKSTPPPAPPQRYVFINPSGPPETIRVRPYGLPAPSTSPVMEWSLPTPSQLAQHFKQTKNLPELWSKIRTIRSMPAFKKDQLIYSWQGIPMMIPLIPVVDQEVYTDYASFYGIPWSVMSMYLDVPESQKKDAEEALMYNVISPLNAMVPETFELLRPSDLPGFFNVTFTEPAGEYWLFYVEPALEPPQIPPGGFGGS